MKQKLLLLSLFFVLAGLLNLRAAKVEIADARKAAMKIYHQKAMALGQQIKADVSVISEYFVRSGSLDLCYVFNMNSGGWVMLSADDRVYPLLAYSVTGALDPSKGSPEFKWWLDGYSEQISHAIKNDLEQSTGIADKWNFWLKNEGQDEPKGSKNVAPLLTSTWDQGIYYNMLCPEDPAGPGGHVYSGCVATCMAQAMYYYRYPVTGTGSHGYYSNYGYLTANFGTTNYEWDKMEDNIFHQYNVAMARLQYHLGIAVDMDYSPDGSGASMWNATNALIDFFGYSPSLHIEQRDDYLPTDWEDLLKTELDSKHPICYAGYGGGGGHAFVCDGYEGSNHFHFNWGWSGYADGYFYLNNLNPAYNFTNWQQAIIGIVPASGYPYGCSGTTTLTGVRGSFEDGSGPISNYGNNANCMWLIDPAIPVEYIKLEFTRFSTENNNDVITVYDGATTSDPVIGTFSGSSLPPQIQSTGDKMLVKFTSNGSLNDQGWLAHYSSVYPEYCNNLTELTTANGSFSDGSASNPYNNSTVCRWRIAPQGVNWISVNFSNFDLDGNDFVRVYDEEKNMAVSTFYGNNLPGNVYIATSKVLVLFMSDNQGTAGGFEATYTSGVVGIAGASPLSGLCVYPNPAKDLLHLTSSVSDGEAVNVYLLTPEGQEVWQRTATPVNGSIDESYDVSALAKGMYFLLIETSASRQSVVITKE